MAFVAHFDSAGDPDFLCSGTVVSTNVVMTAGHCAVDELSGAPLDPSGFVVVTGAVDWTDEASRSVSKVARVVVDPAYNPTTTWNDAALLVLGTPTALPALPLATPAEPHDQPGTGALIAGWGLTVGGINTTSLQWAKTVVQNTDYCGALNGDYASSVMLCSVDYPYNDSGTCNGDSGGPLIAADANHNPVEIGITSTAPTDCNTATADYFTAVAPLSAWARSWINAVAPPPPTRTPAPPAPKTNPPPTKPQLPGMSLPEGRSYVGQTLAGALRRLFAARHHYQTSCSRSSSSRVVCSFTFDTGPNDYWGSVTTFYEFGSDGRVYWTDTYVIHSVDDHCYFHTRHRSRCRITTKRGTY